MHVARVGDGIDHGGVILTGSPDTFCDNVAVARVGDTAICEIHGEVTIIKGANGCYTNGLETARENDLMSCGGIIVRNIGENSEGGVTVAYNGASYSFQEDDLAGSEDDESPDGLMIYRHASVAGTPLTEDEKTRNDALVAKKNAAAATSKEDKTLTNNNSKPLPVECSMFTNSLDYTAKISKNFYLKDVTLAPALSKFQIVEQRGLSIPQIACNLKGLATNILDPLADKYGKSGLLLTSVYRHVNPSRNYVSQHELGQACDIQFPGQHTGSLSGDEWWERVMWIKNNLPYDQFILEYLGKKPWCHISFAPNGGRKQLLTFFAKGRTASGLFRV